MGFGAVGSPDCGKLDSYYTITRSHEYKWCKQSPLVAGHALLHPRAAKQAERGALVDAGVMRPSLQYE